MAKHQAKTKERLIETVLLIFVLVAFGLLIVQLGTNVSDVLEQSESAEVTDVPSSDLSDPIISNSTPDNPRSTSTTGQPLGTSTTE